MPVQSIMLPCIYPYFANTNAKQLTDNSIEQVLPGSVTVMAPPKKKAATGKKRKAGEELNVDDDIEDLRRQLDAANREKEQLKAEKARQETGNNQGTGTADAKPAGRKCSRKDRKLVRWDGMYPLIVFFFFFIHTICPVVICCLGLGSDRWWIMHGRVPSLHCICIIELPLNGADVGIHS